MIIFTYYECAAGNSGHSISLKNHVQCQCHVYKPFFTHARLFSEGEPSCQMNFPHPLTLSSKLIWSNHLIGNHLPRPLGYSASVPFGRTFAVVSSNRSVVNLKFVNTLRTIHVYVPENDSWALLPQELRVLNYEQIAFRVPSSLFGKGCPGSTTAATRNDGPITQEEPTRTTPVYKGR